MNLPRRADPTAAARLTAALAACLLTAAPAAATGPEPAALDLAAVIADLPDEGFAPLSGPWTLELPADHAPHPEARSESWQVSAHLRTAGGEDVGVQLSLLRLGLVPPGAAPPETPWELREVWRGHVALLAPGSATLSEERFSRTLPGIAGFDDDTLRLDGWTLRFEGDALHLDAAAGGHRATLTLTPERPVTTAAGEGAPLRGYAFTRLDTRGEIAGPQGVQPVTGTAWAEHGWGELPIPGQSPVEWDRLQLHLDDGTDLAVLRSRRRDGRGVPAIEGFAVAPDGTLSPLDGAAAEVELLARWRGAGGDWPVSWQVRAGAFDLTVTPVAEDQAHPFAAPLWSGLVRAEGRHDGRPVAGTGTLQLTGYATP